MLELGGGEGLEFQLRGGIYLLPQDRARRDADQIMRFLVLHVAQHQRRFLEPGRAAQRAHVGHEVEVAVAELPVGEFIAGDRIHLHVHGEQVIAGVRAVVDHAVDEHLGIEPLAEEPAVVVGEADDDRFDLALLDELRELSWFQHRACGRE